MERLNSVAVFREPTKKIKFDRWKVCIKLLSKWVTGQELEMETLFNEFRVYTFPLRCRFSICQVNHMAWPVVVISNDEHCNAIEGLRFMLTLTLRWKLNLWVLSYFSVIKFKKFIFVWKNIKKNWKNWKIFKFQLKLKLSVISTYTLWC